MTIDEAIIHAREVANRGCTECNRDHEQLAEWLEELKDLRDKYKNVSEAYMKCNLELFRLMTERNNEKNYTDVLDVCSIRKQVLEDVKSAMYHQCFEVDNDPTMQKWDGGNWIRYKLFENVMQSLTMKPDRE